MTTPQSLQRQLVYGLTLGIVVFWLLAALVSGLVVRQRLDQTFDNAMLEAAQRILPLAVLDILDREEPVLPQRVAPLTTQQKGFAYVVRDNQGNILLQSFSADPAVFGPRALSGFASTALALVAAALFISAAMMVTGLDKRIALWILSRVGAGSRRVIVGAILVGIVLSFFVPSTTARVACLVPIMMGIILAFGVDRRSRLAALIMIATTQAASIWNVGVKTAAAQNMVAIGFIERTLQGTITWHEWLVAAAPFAVLESFALYFILVRMMPPETEEEADRH